MTDIPTLVRYHPGQHLTSELFTTEQEYHRTMRERHNIAAHEWGIAVGLELTPTAVAPGLAVDGYGRELVLPARQQIRTDQFDLLGTDSLDVSLVYATTVQPPGDVTVELPQVTYTVADPNADHGAPVVAFDASRSAPHDTEHPWPVHLGTLTRDPAAPAGTPLTVRTTGRPFIGVRAARVSGPGQTELDLTDGVTVTAPDPATGTPVAVLRWRGRTDSTPATLDVTDALSVAGDLTITDGRMILPEARPAASRSGWRIDHVAPQQGSHREQLRLVLGNVAAGQKPPELVVGAFVEDTFTPCLTVSADGTVTVWGNLVVHGDATLPP